MTEKFRNKYRIESTRLQNWDYGWDACYFITICTANRECFLGDVKNGNMVLSQIGEIATNCWYEIKNHASHIVLGEFVVMPNHIHGILILNGNKNGFINFVDTRHALYQQNFKLYKEELTIVQKRFQNQGKNMISSIVGSYKSAVTKYAHRTGFEFAWQPRFYDHIVRNEIEYRRITEYIKNNPAKWNDDKL